MATVRGAGSYKWHCTPLGQHNHTHFDHLKEAPVSMETRSKRRKAAGPFFSPLQSHGPKTMASRAAPKALSLSPRTPSPREAAASPCEPYTQWHVVVRSLPAPATRTFTIDLADDKPDARIALGRSRIQSDLVVNSRFAQTSRLHCTFRVAGRGAQSTVVVDDACSVGGACTRGCTLLPFLELDPITTFQLRSPLQ